MKPGRLPHDRLRHRPRNGQRRVQYFYFFGLLFIYAFAYFVSILLLFATERAGALVRWSAWRQRALQSARRGRHIRDVTVSIDYRVYKNHGFIV